MRTVRHESSAFIRRRRPGFDPAPTPRQVDIGDVGYFFSSSEAETFSLASVPSSACSEATLHSICDHVGDLPPYSCSREVSQGMADVIGTATANSELLYVMIVAVLARVLVSWGVGAGLASIGRVPLDRVPPSHLPRVS